MKRLLFTILLFTAALPAAAQLYHPGEQLFYRVSYKAKRIYNDEASFIDVIKKKAAAARQQTTIILGRNNL